jgi:conjugative relaxase-like TrwC/TraI family protein
VLSIGKLAPGKHHYYLRSIAEGVEDYYLGAGEAPGRWCGRMAEDLGLSGDVDAASLQQVLGGFHPVTGESLFPERPGRRQPTRPGFDVTLSAPKSVSLLYAFGGPGVQAEVVAAHEAAAAQTLAYLEDNATITRRGHAGIERVSGEGLVVAAFRHRSSRAGDPQLHSHLLVANMTTGVDERVGALYSPVLYQHARTGGFLYQAVLRDQLTRRLGVEWTPVEHGHAEVAGIPREWIDTHSQRRQQILEAQADQGTTSPRSAQLATLATRKPKGRFDVDGETLETQWAARAIATGWDPTAVENTLGRHHAKAIEGKAVTELYAELAGPHGLTEQASTFTRRDVLRAIAERHPDGAARHRIEALADDFLDSPAVVPVVDADSRLCHRDSIRRPDGRVVSGDPNEARYSTPELLAIEHRLVATAIARSSAGVGIVRPEVLDAVLAERATAGTPLGADQEALVRRLTTSGAGVDIVVAKAGTGKTFSLDAARDAWERSGLRVLGASLAGEAADELQRGAGIRSSTIDRLLWDLAHGTLSGGLTANTVLVVDEAGLAGTRKLAELDAYAVGANAKLVLVGDPRQLPEIDAGGLLRGLSTRLPTLELHDNRRQRHGWDGDALDQLRSGDPQRFLAAYRAEGRFVTGPNAAQVRGQLVADWWAAFATSGTEAVMSAPRRADVDDLNRRARRYMAEEGRLQGPTLYVGNRPFQQGDLVMTRINDSRLGVRNGTKAWVDAVDVEAHALRLTTLDGHQVTLGPEYLERNRGSGRPALAHGYAATIHKSQGKTAERTFVLGDDSVFRELAYSAASRHREACTFYVVAGRQEAVELHHPDRPPDPLAEFERAVMRSRAKSLAVDTGADHADLAAMSLGQLYAERAALKPMAAVPEDIALAPQQLRALDRRRDSVSAKVAQLEATEAPPAKLEAAYRELVALDRARPALTARVARLDEHEATLRPMVERRAALDDAIDRRLGRVLRSVEARTPSYITDALGTRPDRWRDLRLWRQGAVAIESYRQMWGVRGLGGAAHPLERALGPEPRSGPQHAQRVQAGNDARQALEALQRSRVIARPGPTLERPGPA